MHGAGLQKKKKKNCLFLSGLSSGRVENRLYLFIFLVEASVHVREYTHSVGNEGPCSVGRSLSPPFICSPPSRSPSILPGLRRYSGINGGVGRDADAAGSCGPPEPC